MPGPHETAPAALNVFLSSTVRDLKAYRLAVRAACRKFAQTTCLLSEEDWPGGYQNTVEKCLQQLKAAQGYLLIIGHWYGSIPPPEAIPAGASENRSVTHLEFDEAFKRWKEANPRPMAVMVPAPGRAADKGLRKAAREILMADGLSEAEHAANLERFRAMVTGNWRTVDQFKDKSELLQLVVARCFEFKGYTPSAAAAGEVVVPTAGVRTELSEAQLGALGRERQIAAAKSIVAELAERPDAPAVAMIASGDQDAGQRAFLHRLAGTVLKKYLPRREPSTLPLQCDTAAIVTWIAQTLGLPPPSPATPESLAGAVAAELKRQQLLFVIDRIDDLADGVDTFRDTVWTPLYGALQELRTRDRFSHRLVAVVADYSGSAATSAATTADRKSPDGTLLRLLPPLGEFTREDLLEWFDEFDVPDEPAGQRAALADRVMKASKGVPLRAFARLRGEVLWPAGVEND